MKMTLRQPFSLLSLTLIACLAVSPTYARSSQPKAGAGEHAPAAEHLSTGSIGSTRERQEKRLQDCMAIWEPATHMTKRQWRRTCKNQLNGFPNL